MHPVLTVLQWGGVTRAIGSYGALLALGLFVGSAVTVRAGERAGLDSGALIAALAGAIGSGFVGAYLAALLALYAQSGSWQASFAQPGIMFYGGVIGGALGLAGFARLFGLPIAPTLDRALPGLPLAHAIGRIGCWLGGCCYGAPCSYAWCVAYTHPLAPAAHPALTRHPWPLYEAAGLLVLAVLFAAPKRFAAQPGRRAASYVLFYAFLRSALEPLRGDAERGVFWRDTCSSAQLIAVFTGGAALAYLIYQWRHGSVQRRRHAETLCRRSLQV